MVNKTSDLAPRLTVEISEKELETARQAKKVFKSLLKDLDQNLKMIYDFKTALVAEHPSQTDLQEKYRGRIIRFKRKTQTIFNTYLLRLKAALEALHPISDSETVKLSQLILSEFDSLSDGVEEFLMLLSEADRDDFTKKLEALCGRLEHRQKSISEIVDQQLFSHFSTDILGKKKISSITAQIHTRRRLLRKMR